MNIYHIGAIDFDPDACELQHGEHLQHLQPQVRSVLLCLVKHQGEVVAKEALVDEAWKGRPASDECLTRCISKLRKHFAAEGNRHVIDTIPRVGYRLRCDDSLPCYSRNCGALVSNQPACSKPEDSLGHDRSTFSARPPLLGYGLAFLAGGGCAATMILLLISV